MKIFNRGLFIILAGILLLSCTNCLSLREVTNCDFTSDFNFPCIPETYNPKIFMAYI